MTHFVVWMSNAEIRHVLKAAELGCAYWAWSKVPLAQAYDEEIDIFDRETGACLGKLDYDKVDKALGKVIDAAKVNRVDDVALGAILRGGEAVDPRTADLIVQYALFNEQKYEP